MRPFQNQLGSDSLICTRTLEPSTQRPAGACAPSTLTPTVTPDSFDPGSQQGFPFYQTRQKRRKPLKAVRFEDVGEFLGPQHRDPVQRQAFDSYTENDRFLPRPGWKSRDVMGAKGKSARPSATVATSTEWATEFHFPL